MFKKSQTKNSILSAHVLNFIRSYVSETTSNELNQDEQKIDFKKIESTVHHYRSPICSQDETELALNTNQMQIDDTLDDKNLDINEFTEPSLMFKAENEFKVPEKSKKENFLKGCKWSPDGTCILVNSNDFQLRIFDINSDFIKLQKEKNTVGEISSSLKLKESGGIYDFAWYPLMNASNPDSACIFSTSKDNPIHLFDAYTGLVRCSYQGYNHLDELVNAYSISFNPSVTKIYCGYNKCIKVFDINRPGKNYKDIKVANNDHKLPGIVSCISFSSIGCYAVGTYSKHIGVYIEENNSILCMLQNHSGGLTHLSFSSDGNYLFSGGRKDPDIYCWDMRNPGRILKVYKRDVKTNQRMYFDLDTQLRYLCSGNDNGDVTVWKANNFEKNTYDEFENNLLNFHAHNDCVNGVSFHPTKPILATTSGQRKIEITEIICSDDTSSSDTEKEVIVRDNSLKIWDISYKK